jgi:predicted DNA binding protein
LVSALRVRVRLTRHDCEVAKALGDRGGFSIVRMSASEGLSTHLVEVEDEEELRGLRRVKVDRNLYLVTTPSCSACRALSELGVIVLGGRSEGGDAVVYDIIVHRNRLGRVLEELERRGLRPMVLSREPYRESALSQAQLAALLTAYRMGAFCPERRARLIDVAKELGVSPATLSENLRKALFKVIGWYLSSKGLSEGPDDIACR